MIRIALLSLALVAATAAGPVLAASGREVITVDDEAGRDLVIEREPAGGGWRSGGGEVLAYTDASGARVRVYADHPMTRREVEGRLREAEREGARAREVGRRAAADGRRETQAAQVEAAQARAEGQRESEEGRREAEAARVEADQERYQAQREAARARYEAERARAQALADID